MNISQLLNRRLILISGKGGVGKTSMAVALGLAASRLQKNTLLVEMNSTEQIAPLFGLDAVGHQEIPLAPHLTGINLHPQKCFEEYVLMRIHFKKIFDLFINNRFVTYFLNAVPGFNELLMVGKVYDLERQKQNKLTGQKQYDLIIVDGLATGHGLSSFEVPSVVNRVVKIGPLHSQSQNILNLINDPVKTALCLVTLPEEMPIAETSEMVQSVTKKLSIALGPIFLNRLQDPRFDEDEQDRLEKLKPESLGALRPYQDYARLAVERAKLHTHYSGELKKRNPGQTIIKIPDLGFEPHQKEDFEKLADFLKEPL